VPSSVLEMMASLDEVTIAARRLRASSAFLRSRMSRMIADTPMTEPSGARMGEADTETSIVIPCLVARCVSFWTRCPESAASKAPRAISPSGIAGSLVINRFAPRPMASSAL
jgi:hypothetical protein